MTWCLPFLRRSGSPVRRWQSERGAALLELPLFLGFIIIPLGFAILTVPTWLQGVHAANDAAAEASRSFVLSGGDPAVVERALRATEVSHGLPAGSLTITSSAPVAGLDAEIQVTVEIELRAIAMLDIGSFTYTGSHVEQYPTYVRTPR